MAMCGLALILLIYAFFIEPFNIQQSTIDIHIPNLPQSLVGFTICHLSDTHTSEIGMKERKLKRMLSGMDVDLGVITGDLVRKRKGAEAVTELLADFHPRLGVFSVPGNSDYKLKLSLSEFIESMEDNNIRFLLNRHASLDVNGTLMHIIGVEDPFQAFDDVDIAVCGLNDDGFRILIAHSPDVVKRLDGHHVDLILAGHTHGGQIKLPWIGALWLHCRYRLGLSDGYYGPEELARKLNVENLPTHLYVSRGIGSSSISARFLCRPEVTVITLR